MLIMEIKVTKGIEARWLMSKGPQLSELTPPPLPLPGSSSRTLDSSLHLLAQPILHSLQRCGVEAIVLEARDRVGGRVHTLTGQGFSAGVDLGASIITGTATNAERGLRCDPSATIAK